LTSEKREEIPFIKKKETFSFINIWLHMAVKEHKYTNFFTRKENDIGQRLVNIENEQHRVSTLEYLVENFDLEDVSSFSLDFLFSHLKEMLQVNVIFKIIG